MAKNQQNGLTQPLDSEATKNSQPTKLFIPGAEDIAWANPESPSTNPETRREKYNIETSGSTVPESWISTNIWPYSTTSLWQPKNTWTTTESMIKPLAWDYASQGGDTAWDLVKKQLDSLWIDEKNKMYGSLVSQTYDNLKQSLYDLWNLNIQWMWIEATQAANVQEVINLTQQVAMAVALWERDPAKIAATLGQDENVIRMILQWKGSELVQLNEEYKQRQLRSYYQAAEDYGINIARNMQDFQNYKTYTDNQFNSTMETLKRSLFDSERAARTSSAIFWMTGTKYTLDRIQAQYNQQMRDVTDSYQYQSAQAQISINRAIEDYGKNMERLWIELDEGEKALQAFVLQEMTNLNNSIGLTIQQQEQILGNLRTTIAQTKADGYQKIVSAWEDGNATLAQKIADAYGLTVTDLWTHQFTNAELGRTSTSTIGNDTNNLWHILASDDWTRIWTYKSANGYTYNVYATREDWLLATQWLLQRAYYGKTLREAAQKWIGQGKDISWAVAVLKELWLDPNAILSDENVRKFMEAIGRREWTIKAWETLDDWVKWGKDLSWYWTPSSWWETVWWNYDKAYTKDYDRYLTNWRDSFKKSTQDALIQQFWSMDNFIKNAQEYSESVIQPQQAQTFQNSLDILVEFNKAWNKLNDRQRWVVKKLWVKDSYQSWLYSDEVNNAVNLYKQLMAQWFIQNIIDSKKKWATYGPLSDNEWGKIQDAYSSMKLNAPEYVQGYIDYMMYDLSTAITELWWTPDIESWLQRDISYLYNNSNTQSEFNTPGSAYTWVGSVNNWTNSQWAYQSWTVNTWATQMWWN